MVLFPILGPVIQLTHTTPGRLLSHLRKLTREGESLLGRPPFLTPLDEAPWDARVWKCLAKIAAPDAFAGATQLDGADVGDIDRLDFERPSRLVSELDELRACLNKERGCVEDQPQHAEHTAVRRNLRTCCGGSKTPQPRSGVFRQAQIRRRIRRRLVTLASVIERVEALAELPAHRPDKQS